MPHAIPVEELAQFDVKRSSKSKSQSKHVSKHTSASSRDLRHLQELYTSTRSNYLSSPLKAQLHTILSSKSRPQHITKLISLGLGSFQSVNASRVMKQLVIFLEIASYFQSQPQSQTPEPTPRSQSKPKLAIYAQDPSFTKLDTSFLHSLGLSILHTPSPTSGGEALSLIYKETLIYSPFLTFEAYRLFFEGGREAGVWVGDDFEFLGKVGKGGRGEVEGLGRMFVGWRRRVVGTGDGGEGGFWEKEEKAVPMGVYWREEARRGKMVRMKSML